MMQKKKYDTIYRSDIVLDNNSVIDFIELDALNLPPSLFSNVYLIKNYLKKDFTEKDIHKFETFGYNLASINTTRGLTILSELYKKYKCISMSDKEIVALSHEKNILCCTNDFLLNNINKTINNRESINSIDVLFIAYENKVLSKEQLILKLKKYLMDINPKMNLDFLSKILSQYNLPPFDNVIRISSRESKFRI